MIDLFIPCAFGYRICVRRFIWNECVFLPRYVSTFRTSRHGAVKGGSVFYRYFMPSGWVRVHDDSSIANDGPIVLNVNSLPPIYNSAACGAKPIN